MRRDQPRKLAKGPLLLAALMVAGLSLAAQVIPPWQVLAYVVSGAVLGVIAEVMQG